MNGPKREIFYVSWHSETNLKVQCTHRYWVWYEGSTFLLHGFDRFLTRTLSYSVCPLIDHMNKNVGHENWFILWSNTLSAYWKRFSIFYKYILLARNNWIMFAYKIYNFPKTIRVCPILIAIEMPKNRWNR